MWKKNCGLRHIVKVKYIPRSTLDDLDHHIILRIQIKSTIMSTLYILQQTTGQTSKEIQDDLVELKPLVNEKLVQCIVWLPSHRRR